MIQSLREDGGRAYAIGVVGIASIVLLSLIYFLMLVVFVRENITPEYFVPLGGAFLAIGGIAGTMQLPNTAERWRGGYAPHNDPRQRRTTEDEAL